MSIPGVRAQDFAGDATYKDGEVSFWRGEWKDDVMTGIISRQLEKGNEEYYFTSASWKEIPKTSEESEEKEETKINPVEEVKTRLPMSLAVRLFPRPLHSF